MLYIYSIWVINLCYLFYTYNFAKVTFSFDLERTRILIKELYVLVNIRGSLEDAFWSLEYFGPILECSF